MSTTVRIRDEDKAALDSIQARLVLTTGHRLALDEVLHRMVHFAQAHIDKLALMEEPTRLSPEQIAAVLALGWDEGPPTDESTIDEALYGKRLHPT